MVVCTVTFPPSRKKILNNLELIENAPDVIFLIPNGTFHLNTKSLVATSAIFCLSAKSKDAVYDVMNNESVVNLQTLC